MKILEDGEEEEEEEMEEEEGGGGLDIAVEGQTVETVETVQAEGLDAEKKAAMIRSGKTLEERQEEFKEMLLERGVRNFFIFPLYVFTTVISLSYTLTLSLSLSLSRCLPSLRGTRSCQSSSLIPATCCSTPRRGGPVSRSS